MKILVSDKIDDAALELLQDRGFEIELLIKPDDETLHRAAEDADGWIIRSGTQITAEVLERAKKLKVIGRAGVGVDNIDLDTATRQGIAVLNTPSGNTIAAVEHTMAMLLALVRHIPAAHSSVVSKRSWDRTQFTGTELCGKTIGILGLGKIGSRVASRCQAMEMRILGYDPFLASDQAKTMNIELEDDLKKLVKECDFLSLHLPATDETNKIINKDILQYCKPGIRIVNCARGSLIDEQDLADFLKSGHVAGAALDVFDIEPPINSPLLKISSVIATPHLGAHTIESQRNVGTQIAQQVADALSEGIFREAVNIPVNDWLTYSRLKPKLELAEKMGHLAQQYANGGISKIHVEYCGGGYEEIPAINNTVLKGILKSATGTSINTVNAPLVANERGLSITHSETESSGNYRSLMRLTVEVKGTEHTFCGTTFSDGEPRLLEVDGVEVDLLLYGHLLFFLNLDQPGVVGNVGAILGENKINIAHFSLGRQNKGGQALGVIAVDARITKRVVGLLADLTNMQWVKQVILK
jgi:D-3-phosphoglycerate dehydrogenase